MAYNYDKINEPFKSQAQHVYDDSPSDPGVLHPSLFAVLPSSQTSEQTLIASSRPNQILAKK